MSDNDSRQHESYGQALASYAIGLAIAVVLTGLAFATVAFHWAGHDTTLAIVFGLALAQIVIHFRFFLHIDLRKSARDDLQLILFSTLITLLMVGGTLVVLFNLRTRMM